MLSHLYKITFLFLLCIYVPAHAQKFTVQSAEKKIEKAQLLHDSILGVIKDPVFPSGVFNIMNYGAKADGGADSRPAINKAIIACNAAGGGKVVIPAGLYQCNGPIVLLSNVNLHLERGSLVRFGDNHLDYTPLVKTRWEGTICYNYSPLIYAYRCQNIALTGHGVLDGNGSGAWDAWNDLKVEWSQRLQKIECNILRKMGNDSVPEEQRVFGNGYLDLNGDGKDDGYGDGKEYHLRPQMFQPYECENVLLEGVTLCNSPFWTVNPVFCTNLTVRGITVQQGTTNDDGIDPDGCRNVLIENCFVDTHDDAISIKAGRDQDAWDKPVAENIIVRNCTLKTTCNGFCIGSEMSAGVRNVFFYKSTILDAGYAIDFKCNLDRGGFIENIYINNINVVKATTFLLFTMDYHSYRGNNFPTRFNDFYLQNITCGKLRDKSIEIKGVPQQSINRVFLQNILLPVPPAAGEIKYTRDLIFDKVKEGGHLVKF